VTVGEPERLQGALKAGSPVHAMPSGAAVVVEGVATASNGAMARLISSRYILRILRAER
jgi:hypothetical protein